MDYLKEITKLRDNMHREIIRETIHGTGANENMTLVLEEPIQLNLEHTRPGSRKGREDILITGVDGNSNELTGMNLAGEERLIYYRDIPVEILAILHRNVTGKCYTIEELVLC
jgi:hypothetical protein